MNDDTDSIEGMRWLDRNEMSLWLSLSGLLFRLPASLDAQLQKDSDLSFVEYMVLAVLSDREERSQRMSELASIIGTSLSRLSHLVSRLERSGFVTRAADPADGRFTLAHLSNRGLAKVVESAPGHVTMVRELVMSPLSVAQVRQLAKMLGSIFENVDPHGAVQVQRYLAAADEASRLGS